MFPHLTLGAMGDRVASWIKKVLKIENMGSGGIEKSHSCKWAKWIQWHALPHIQQSTQQRNKGYYPNLHGWDFSIPPSPKYVSFRKQGNNQCMIILPVAPWFWPQDLDYPWPWNWKSMAKLLRFQFKFIIFWAYVPHLKFLQWKQWHLNLLWVPEYLGDIGLKLRKTVFKMHIFSEVIFPFKIRATEWATRP